MEQLELPVVTVVIPVHNHQQWVAGAIESVTHQDYPADKLRIVVIDDGSQDGSADMVRAQLESHRIRELPGSQRETKGMTRHRFLPLIMVSRSVAEGPSSARNLGIQIGWDGTDIFGLLDSDDEYDRLKIRKSVNPFLVSDKIGVVYSDYDTLRPDGLRIRQYKEPFSRDRLVQECIINCNSLVLKEAFEDCGTFDPEMRVAEDYDLWMRISEKYVCHHLAESLVTIRVGEHSSSAQVPTEIWRRNWQRVMSKAEERFRNA